jgi:hypothetical protein
MVFKDNGFVRGRSAWEDGRMPKPCLAKAPGTNHGI